jgi:transcriptional regulator with XRE-family HTH domain
MRTITQYTHYNFKDRDPVFDRLFAIIDGHGLSLKQVADASGVTYQTLRNWKSGKTRNAYYANVVRVVIGLRRWDFKLIDTDVRRSESIKVVRVA